MRRLVKNTLLVLLLALLGSRADSTSIRETIPLPLASDKTSVIQDFGHAKEGTKESYTQGGYTKAIHQFAPSPVVPFRVSVPARHDVFLFISIRNKPSFAPRSTTLRSVTRHHLQHNLLCIPRLYLSHTRLNRVLGQFGSGLQ